MFDYPKLYDLPVIDRAISWLATDEAVGVSSFTIFRVMMRNHIHDLDKDVPTYGLHSGSAPSDFYDFGRCYRLLKIIPEWKDRLNEILEYYPLWKNVINNWYKLETAYELELSKGKSYSYDFDKILYDIMYGS